MRSAALGPGVRLLPGTPASLPACSWRVRTSPTRMSALPVRRADNLRMHWALLACGFDPFLRHHSPALRRRATKPAPAPITITISAMPDGSGTGCEANETVSNPPGVQPATVCCSQFAPPSLVW